MVSKKEIKELFDLAEVESREEELRRKAALNQEIEAERKALMLEYILEHLNPSALIAIHQTNHFPRGGKIKPTGHFLLDLFKSKNPQKIIEDLQLRYPRFTIHFTLNYPIEGVASRGQWLSWEGKYAVLIPVKDFMERIVCLNPVDTWIIGELDLPSSAEILISEDEYNVNPDDWNALAGKAKVIPFPQGEKIQEVIKKRISKKGYNVTYGHDHGWYESDDLLYLNNFIRKSPFLSFDEKQRLISLAVKKGYQTWNQIFWSMADKYKKITIPHWKTLWRDIETYSEHVLGIIFEPHYDEEKIPAKEIKHKLEALAAEADNYGKKVQEVIDEDKFASREEKASLKLLVNELEKIKIWIVQLLHKIENLSENISWKQFLQQEKII